MKRIAATALALLLLLPLAACMPAYEDLPPLEGVTLSLTDESPITKDTDELNIALTNGSEFDVMFGEEFRLEVQRNGAWRRVGQLGPVIAIGYPVDPGETFEHTYRVSALTKRPKTGAYRLGVPFSARPVEARETERTFAEELQAAKKPATPYTKHIAYAYFEMVP